MDWNRAKNLILVILCLLNLFLFGNWLYVGHINADASDTLDELSKYLESRGVAIDCDIPSEKAEKRQLLISQNSEKFAVSAAQRLVHTNEEPSGGIVESEYGNASVITGAFDVVLYQSYSIEDMDIISVVALLEDAGISGEVSYEGTNAVIKKTCGEDGQPVFNALLNVWQEDNTWRISGQWFFGDPVTAGDETEHGAAGLIVQFTDKLLSQGAPLKKIISIDKGYITQTITNIGAKLIPAYRIETDTGFYYISALDAGILDV